MNRVWIFFLLLFSLSSWTSSWAAPRSLYTSKMLWRDEAGESVELGRYRNRWVVISMMYTTCRGSCPLIVQKMRKVESEFERHGRKAEFVLVTFDPTRDTPSKLRSYREKIGVSESNWHFLSGAPSDTRKLSMLLGIKFSQDPDSGEFMHDNKIVLLSPEGAVHATLPSLSESETELLK